MSRPPPPETQNTPGHAPVVAPVCPFVEQAVGRAAPALDHAGACPHALVARMKDLGLFGALVPSAWGGLGLGATTHAQVIEAPWGFLPEVVGHGGRTTDGLQAKGVTG